MAGREDDLGHRVLAGVDAVLHVLLNTVVHGVADDVHDGVADAVHDGLVHLGVLAHQDQLGLLVQLLAHVADDAVHLLEGGRDGDHPQGHGHILKLVGELAQLPGGLGKGVQLESLELRGAGDHGLGDDDLAHHGGQLIQLAQADADQALLVVGGPLRLGAWMAGRRSGSGRLGRGGRGGGRSRGSGRGRSGGLGGRSGGGRRGGGRLGMVDGLIGADGTGAGDDVDGVVPVGLVAEGEQETGFRDLSRRGGVMLHALRRERKIVVAADLANGGDQHEGAQILHAAALVKEDLKGVGEAGHGGGGLSGGLRGGGLRRGGLRSGSLSSGRAAIGGGRDLLDEAINLLQETVDILS